MGTVYNNFEKHNDPEYIEQCEVYKDYIITHVKNVMTAYVKLFKNEDYTDRLPDGISEAEWVHAMNLLPHEIAEHDASKWSTEEFEPYRRHFDPTQKEKMDDKEDENIRNQVEDDYQYAWRHHYLHNKHHPEYWKYTDIVPGKDGEDDKIIILQYPLSEARDMDLVSILHMICDWSGMSLKFRNRFSPISWYNTQAKDEREAMSNNTKRRLKALLEMIFPGEEVKE